MSDLPYPGLRPFNAEETDIFFGREAHADELLDKLGETRFLAVLGPSGYGKSSLVRTGLLAGLSSGFMTGAGAHWRIADMRPGNRPFVRLAKALLKDDALGRDYLPEALEAGDGDALEARHAALEKQLRNPYGLHEVWREIKSAPGKDGDLKLLLLADQFEELFRYYRQGPADDVTAFIAFLLAAAEHPDLYVVITMRSDFIGDCSMFHGLPEAINRGLYLVPRLTREQLREAVTMPARVFGGRVEDPLANRLLNDAGNDPDQLPLLQHALMRMWDLAHTEARRHGGGETLVIMLTMEHYRQIGGFFGALSGHADLIYQELSPEHRRIAEILFRGLTELGPDNRAVRRPIKLAEAAALAGVAWWEMAEVAEIFRASGRNFIMPPPSRLDGSRAETQRRGEERKLAADTVLDISHESLIRQWARLNEWVRDEVESAALYRRLLEAAQRWRDGQGELWHGLDVETAQAWSDRVQPNEVWAERYTDVSRGDKKVWSLLERRMGGAKRTPSKKEESLREKTSLVDFADAMRFLDVSYATHNRAQKKLRLLTVSALFLLIAVLAGFGWFLKGKADEQTMIAQAKTELAEQKEQEAKTEAGRADREKIETQRIQSLFLADLAWQQTGQGNAVNGMLLALEALPKDMNNPDRPYVIQAVQKLYKAVYAQRERLVLPHEGRVNHAAFSPDGTWLVTASDDYTARLWDVQSGRVLHTLSGHEKAVIHAAFSPDGTQLVTASDDWTARLWDVQSGQVLHILSGHEALVRYAAFSPDGTQLVTASSDNLARLREVQSGLVTASSGNTARLWDVQSGRVLHTLSGHKSYVNYAAFNPDSTQLVTASSDNTVRLWDVQSGRVLHIFSGHKKSVTHTVFSPNGTQLVTASSDNTARLWDVQSGRVLHILSGHKKPVTHAVFSLDGTQLVTASSDNTAQQWDVQSGRVLHILSGHKKAVTHAAFSPDGTQLVTASSDNTAWLWDVQSGRVLHIFSGHEALVRYAAFSPDGTQLVTASYDNTARLWDVQSGQFFYILKGHENDVDHAAFSPDGTRLVTASKDSSVRLWDGLSGQLLHILSGHEGNVNYAAFSPDGTWLVTASDDNTARLWDVLSGQLRYILVGHENDVNHAVFSSDNTYLATASFDKSVRLWDARTGQLLHILRHKGLVRHVAFSPDSLQLATASYDKTARLWDVRSGQLLYVFRGHTGMVWNVAFNPDGTRLATASSDSTVRLWDVRSGQLLYTLSEHEHDVNHADFSPDGTQLVSASDDYTARLWDVRSGRLLHTLSGHERWIRQAVFSPDGTQVATASYDDTARLWDTRNGQLLHTFSGHESDVNHAAFSPDGMRLATASDDNTARLWQIIPTAWKLIDYANAKLPRHLTVRQRKQFFLPVHKKLRIAETLLVQGKQQARKGNIKAAVATFQRALENNPALTFDPKIKTKILAADGLLDKGIKLAAAGKLNEAVAVFDQVKALSNNFRFNPKAKAEKIYVASLISNGENLARKGKLEEAIAEFHRAISLDSSLDFNAKAKAEKFYLVSKGKTLAIQGKIDEALACYTQAEQLDRTLKISADSWGILCQQGSLHRKAAQVLSSCEKAVKLAPDDYGIRDNRAFARALTGNIQGAIMDFQFYIEKANNKKHKAKRQVWVKALQKGDDPFTPELLEEFKYQ
ncbi:MAG: hypothetical protein GY862_02125 [Gammaproteobacteria bacterium]|nr:hypothetical protein [Gammaproteobacteria bacterium]